MEQEKQVKQLKSETSLFRTIAITFIALVAGSTALFHYVEKWDWLDSFYFTIVTISTVGYGNLIPQTDLGKIANILLIIIGIGIFTVFVTQLVKRQGLRRLEKQLKGINKKKD
jgi:voltage-gated potassium channel